jgi:hypothetical protein
MTKTTDDRDLLALSSQEAKQSSQQSYTAILHILKKMEIQCSKEKID